VSATAGRVPAWSACASPLGPVTLVGSAEGLVGLYLDRARHDAVLAAGTPRDDDLFAPVVEQVAAYFAGTLDAFDVRTAPAGTPFARRVAAAVREVPLGATTTYGEIAAAVGSPGAARAVGAVSARNPLSLVVPCHRVLGADGLPRGSGGGTEHKKWLLRHEASVLRVRPQGR
jgi:methylated-DNA-[protein]-cysteine S-methyltransferase